ncbi:alcohol dehydrogenase catalytic domain-containing protein [Mycolicibacterium fortuitum]|uniref:alcohol dehydrogenase catalytic domain-containing protein n=1 Tax=Mycolicibacterium fortuitum TaxID=1766 RepID=UPI001AEF842D|nr:alcohol dehydrogenase catalytic domain-containing protein [Mycolicibacterium fortuitum]MBP3082689.1 alcohol dehydrogenase catalytic domain-containing protein [Mycolicibacterium fortuitum]
MRELTFVRTGHLRWIDRPAPTLQASTDALVRPFVASRCDGDTLPLHRPVSRPMQAGLKLGLLAPVIGHIAGPCPFKGPFGIGHECVAQVTATGSDITNLAVGDIVVVPWALSCGVCLPCQRGLTAKCSTMCEASPGKTLAAFGFGPQCGPWGGMVADTLRIPNADHMLVKVPAGVDPLRVAAASDNLADAWRSVVPALRKRPGARVLVLGGGGKSIGLYAAGLAAAHGAEVEYTDNDQDRLTIAAGLGARVHAVSKRGSATGRCGYDIVVEAASNARGLRDGLRALAPGGACVGTGYYVRANTKLPVMDMYATSATLQVGVSHVRSVLPELLDFIAQTGFEAERVTTLLADWDDAPAAYQERTTKVVLHRPPLNLN